ncbi:MAG TPA: Coq4 family protein, partial [Stellaceae bacterium]|nr:Coq4 family protein [Stellaceae bacterium]
MQQSTTPRIHPIVALRALRGLLRDREDTRQAFLLVEALRGKTGLRQFARFRASEGGRALLARRPSLLSALSDRARLAGMPPDSLGRAYLDFVSAENLSAEGLVEASKILAAPPPDEAMTWFRARNREMHDLLHVTAGYGRDPLGEACVLAFTFAQSRSPGAAVIATVGAWRNLRRLKSLRAPGAVWEAYRQGRRAAWVVAADWENLLAQPLETVRANLQI